MDRTYSLMSHAKTGETYAIEFDERDQITGAYGPIWYGEAERLIDADLGDLEYDDFDGAWAATQEWRLYQP
jgi:hypothetical protein